MIVGTAGHIDHGKTALVGALSGVDTDRLKEEKARGISIDLGFAYLPTPFGATIGFVDVPGHERFVHNMLAGAAGIDFVLLVVAADDGLMPQTIEHLAIVDILGIERGIVVLNKIDLVDSDRLAAVKSEIAAVLAGVALSAAEIVEASSMTGEGVDALRDKLFDAARSFGERKPGGRFCMAVDRSFTLGGVGTVVTGTVRSGEIALGDHVLISPSGREARVRGIHAQNRAVERGQVGDRCALNLAGDGISKDAVARGDVILDPFLHAPTDRIDATLRVLPSELKPVRQWTPVRLHHGATELGARIVLLADEPLQPGSEAPIQIVLERPIAAASGDRFVIRDTSARRTLGGGFFLDLRAPGRRRKTPERLSQLRAHAVADSQLSLLALLDCQPGFVDLDVFARDRALTEGELEAIVTGADVVRLTGPKFSFALSRNRWSKLKDDLRTTLERFHGDRPNEAGMDIEKLRLQLKPRLPAPVFVTMLRGLAGDGGIAVEAAKVRLAGHSVSLPPRDEAIWRKIEPLIEGNRRFAPPRVRDLGKQIPASETEVRRVLKLAARMGKVIEAAPDEFLMRPAIAEIVETACNLAAVDPGGAFSVAQFRDRLAIGRNVSVRILEYLDRQGLTIRQGDVRKINRQRVDLFNATAGANELNSGGEAFPVERPDFKSGRGRKPVFGGFDPHSLPPDS